MLLFLFFLLLQPCFAQNCYRFCSVTLIRGYFNIINENNINILNLEECSHLVLDAYDENYELDYTVLEKAYLQLQKSNTPSNIKVFAHILNSFSSTFNTFSNESQKILNYFDGFHILWDDSKFSGALKFKEKPLNVRQNFLSDYLLNFKKTFKEKKIIVTVGAEPTLNGYFDFTIFKNTVDFIALKSRENLIDLYMKNKFSAKVRHDMGAQNLITLDELAKTWTNNGFSKGQILIFIYDVNSESRIKTIWSSLNNFAGIFINRIEVFKQPSNHLPEMGNEIKKFEKMQICSSDSSKKNALKLLCYVSLKEDLIPENNNLFKNCDKIIFKKENMNSNGVLPKHILEKYVEKFRTFSFNDTGLILSIHLNAGDINQNETINRIASGIVNFIQIYNFNGIEFVCDESLNDKTLQDLISTIYLKSADIQIGLQVNVFKVSKTFIPIINNVTWVTHKINSLSDPALEIYYQWNKLHENYGLNLEKVVIKISPGIWQQDAEYPYPSFTENTRSYLKDENPENDVILSRKYLCLNETIKSNLPSTNSSFYNLPMILTIHEDLEKRKERVLSDRKKDKRFSTLFTIQFFMMGMSLSTDLCFIRYETKETLEYKFKMAEKHGFGGIALDSINVEDDLGEFCGKSLFTELTAIYNK